MSAPSTVWSDLRPPPMRKKRPLSPIPRARLEGGSTSTEPEHAFVLHGSLLLHVCSYLWLTKLKGKLESLVSGNPQ